MIRVNGALHLASGSPAAVEIVTFAIYAEQSGGQPVWQETQNLTVSGDGQYSALLGATLPEGLPLDVFTSPDTRWLEVHVERSGEPPSPRVQLASVPFALRASDAETLGGKPASAFLLAEPVFSGQSSRPSPKTSPERGRPVTTFDASQGFIPLALNNTGALGNSVLFQGFPAGSSIGLGTTAPRDYFHVSFDDQFGAFTGMAVQNRNGSANASSGMLFYDQNGALAQFQGFSNATHEYRINNIAAGGTINFLIGSSSKFLVNNSGDISIAGALLKAGNRIFDVFGDQTFVGLDSGNQTMTGPGNTAVGFRTLEVNTTGEMNAAFGQLALAANTTGEENTAIGMDALASTTSGTANAVLGTAAMFLNTGGSFNTAIGHFAGVNATGSDNIYLGAEVFGVPGESRTMYLGKVGTQTRTLIAGVRGVTTGVADAVSVVIDSTGQLGTINSSRRYKEDIQNMGDASSALMKLRPVTFRYTQPYADGSKPIDYGLIAEEVEAVYPDLVAHLADGQVETVQYHKINAMLLNEVQKQHAEIAALKLRLEALERERR